MAVTPTLADKIAAAITVGPSTRFPGMFAVSIEGSERGYVCASAEDAERLADEDRSLVALAVRLAREDEPATTADPASDPWVSNGIRGIGPTQPCGKCCAAGRCVCPPREPTTDALYHARRFLAAMEREVSGAAVPDPSPAMTRDQAIEACARAAVDGYWDGHWDRHPSLREAWVRAAARVIAGQTTGAVAATFAAAVLAKSREPEIAAALGPVPKAAAFLRSLAAAGVNLDGDRAVAVAREDGVATERARILAILDDKIDEWKQGAVVAGPPSVLGLLHVAARELRRLIEPPASPAPETP